MYWLIHGIVRQLWHESYCWLAVVQFYWWHSVARILLGSQQPASSQQPAPAASQPAIQPASQLTSQLAASQPASHRRCGWSDMHLDWLWCKVGRILAPLEYVINCDCRSSSCVESRHWHQGSVPRQLLEALWAYLNDSYGKSRKKRKTLFRCDFWAIVGLNLRKRYVKKLREIIILQFELSFSICFWEIHGRTSNSSFLRFRDFGTCPRLPKPFIFSLETPGYFKKTQKNHIVFICLNLKTLEL